MNDSSLYDRLLKRALTTTVCFNTILTHNLLVNMYQQRHQLISVMFVGTTAREFWIVDLVISMMSQ